MSLPALLYALPRWHPGAWGAPAVILSFTSAVFCLAVVAYLSRSPVARAVFHLPFPPYLLGTPVAVVAWTIAACCRTRPGGKVPRLWVLLLGCIASSTVFVSLFHSATKQNSGPWVHALTVASAMSVMVLALRLLRVRPNQELVSSVSVLGLGAVLLFGIPSVVGLDAWVLQAERARLDETTRRLKGFAQEIKEVSTDGREPRARTAAAAVERLRSISIATWAPDYYGWRAIHLVGDVDRFVSVQQSLTNALHDALFAPPRWRRSDGERETPPAEAVGYYREIGRLYRELEHAVGPPVDHATVRDPDWHRRAAVGEFRAYLAGLAKTWDGHWLVTILDPSIEAPALSHVLQLPLVGDSSYDRFRAAAIADLMDLPASIAQTFNGRVSGCRWREGFGLDCDTYVVSAKPPGVEPLAQLQLVYGGEVLPSEIVFRFPILSGREPKRHGEEATRALHDAVHGLYGVKPTAEPDGVVFMVKGRSFHVTAPSPGDTPASVQLRVSRR